MNYSGVENDNCKAALRPGSALGNPNLSPRLLGLHSTVFYPDDTTLVRMSFGFGVGDFTAVGTLAWNVYKSCKGAPDSFGDISFEVLSLHAVLKEAEETVLAQPLSPTKQERLKAVADGCHHVLKDLDNLVQKYEGLGTQGKRTWDRMRWGTEDVTELRARLTSNAVLLTAWISTSQAHVEKKLAGYMQECKEGKRQGSVITDQTMDSLCMDEKQVWRAIRKELEDIGITVAAFEANKEFIFEWFAKAVASGAFEEQSFGHSPTFAPPEESSGEQLNVAEITSRVTLGLEAGQNETPVFQVAVSSPPNVGHSNAGAMLSSVGAIGNRSSIPLPKTITPIRATPRLAALIGLFGRPNKNLITAVEEKNFSKVWEILNDQSKVVWLDSRSLDRAMFWAVRQGHEEVVRLLLDKDYNVNTRILRGAKDYNVNTGIQPYSKGCGVEGRMRLYTRSVLNVASEYGHERVVRRLLQKGAEIDAEDNPLIEASENGHEQVVRLLLEHGAFIDARSWMGSDGALCIASKNGHEPVVRLLLKEGGAVNNRTLFGGTPLEGASKYGHEKVVRLLLEMGANVHASGGFRDEREISLYVASANGHHQVVRLLLEKGADFNAGAGRSALQIASENGHEKVVQLLLEKGADANAGRDNPLQVASANGHEQVVRLLLENGATDVHELALHAASENGREQVVQLLFEKGVDNNVSARRYDGIASAMWFD